MMSDLSSPTAKPLFTADERRQRVYVKLEEGE